jgi:hypothetical protein
MRRSPSGTVQAIAWLPAVAGFAVVMATGILLWSTYYGDPSIYLPFARNLAHGHFFRFDPHGDFSSGVASPLWVLVLSIPFALGAGAVAAKGLALVLTLVAYTLTVWAVYRLANSPFGAGIAGLIVGGALSIWGVMAYDSALAVGLVAVGLVAAARVKRAIEERGSIEARDALPLAVVFGLFGLSRPDVGLFVPIILFALWAFGPLRDWHNLRVVLALTAVALIPAAAYYLYALAETSAISVSSETRTYDNKLIAHKVGSIYYSNQALTYLRSMWEVFIVAAIGLVLAWRGRRSRWVLVCALLGIALYATALIFYPVTTYTERYFLPATPLIGLLAAMVIARTSGRVAVALGAIALIATGPWALRPIGTARAEREKGYTFNEITEREAAQRVNAIAPHGSAVLAYEVQDRWNLRDDLTLLALNGIIDGKVFPYREDADMTGFLERYKPATWIANDPVNHLPYSKNGVLGEVYRQLRRQALGSTIKRDGIRFKLVAKRDRPIPSGFAGWRYIVQLSY